MPLVKRRASFLPYAIAAFAMLFASTQALNDARAQGAVEKGPPAHPVLLDRVVVRWHAPETGGIAKPQFVFERELAFEARIEALVDSEKQEGGYSERNVRAALDRHIAESLLASLPVVPEPKPEQIAARAEAARAILEQRVHGRDKLIAVAALEGISSDDLDAILRRSAHASIYLDRMVAPMLEPSELELRDVWKQSPFKELGFDRAKPALQRWYVGQRLAQATDAYYQSARSRVVLTIVHASR